MEQTADSEAIRLARVEERLAALERFRSREQRETAIEWAERKVIVAADVYRDSGAGSDSLAKYGVLSKAIDALRAARLCADGPTPPPMHPEGMRIGDQWYGRAIRENAEWPDEAPSAPSRADILKAVQDARFKWAANGHDGRSLDEVATDAVLPVLQSMREEIAKLREDVKGLDEHAEAMEERAKWPPCACMYDDKEAVCAVHSPAVAKAKSALSAANAKLEEARLEVKSSTKMWRDNLDRIVQAHEALDAAKCTVRYGFPHERIAALAAERDAALSASKAARVGAVSADDVQAAYTAAVGFRCDDSFAARFAARLSSRQPDAPQKET